MQEKTTGKQKYLCYFDILGFTELIKNKSPDEIYNVITEGLKETEYWEKANHLFSTICFSDTIVFYQTKEEFLETAFLDAYGITGEIIISLLAKQIPVRAAITFGDFYVKSHGRHLTFWGEALIEACRLEKQTKMLGAVIAPSAFNQLSRDELINPFIRDKEFKETQGHLLLNCFSHCKDYGVLNSTSWKDTSSYLDDTYGTDNDLKKELKAIHFIAKETIKYKTLYIGNDTDIYLKYQNTLNFIEEMLENGIGEKRFQNALNFAQEFYGKLTL